MQKDRNYHESAIEYNEEIAEFAEALSGRLKDKYGEQEPVRWSLSVAKQHRFHAGRHKKALQKLENQNLTTVNTEDGGEDRVVDDEHIVHRSSATGEFVTEEFADKHPRTTEEQHVGNMTEAAEAPMSALPGEEAADDAALTHTEPTFVTAPENSPEAGA